MLINVGNNPILLTSNGNFSWSVQLSGTTIYKKLSIEEVKEKAKMEALEEVKVNKSVDISELLQENRELKKMIKDIRNTTIKEKEKKNKKK